MFRHHMTYHNQMSAYIRGLTLRPEQTYRFSMEVLGGAVNVYLSARGIPQGNRSHFTEPSTEWMPFSFEFTTGSSPELSDFASWGIAFLKSPKPPIPTNGEDTFIDNVTLVNINDPTDVVIVGGDFEAHRRDPIYNRNWAQTVLGSSGKGYGIRIVDDPLRHGNRCLLLPRQYAPLSENELPMLESFNWCADSEHDIPCVHLSKTIEFVLVKHGRATCEVDGNVQEARDGEILFFPQGQSLKYTLCGGAGTSYYRINFNGASVPSVCAALKLEGIVSFPVVNPTALIVLMEKMMTALPRLPLQTLAVDGQALQWLAELEAQRFPEASAPKYSETLESIAAHLREAPEVVVDNDTLSAHCGLGKTQFINLFKAQFGVTPHRYRLQHLMGKACALLLSTEMTVQEIAYTLGVDDPQYFSRLFKSMQGCTPRDYRNRYRR